MADGGQLTPEKQLLKLIEQSKDEQSPSLNVKIQGAKLDRAGKSFLSLGALRGALFGRFSFLKRSTAKKITASRQRFDLKRFNILLAVVAFCLLVYVAGDTVASALSLQKSPNFNFQKETSMAAESTPASSLKDSAYYLQKVSSRDIFKEGGLAAKKETKKEAVSQDNPIKNSLSLVGISWSQNPDVIIEDKTKQKTFFVKRGQMVGDSVKVEAIFKDHVILSYDGQEFELR